MNFDALNEITGFDTVDFSNRFICYASPRETHGPVVKTGPTAGQNRSRNKDGTWRKNAVTLDNQENNN